jgi:uncharacterized membrane protein YbhN (UPF0104 family)
MATEQARSDAGEPRFWWWLKVVVTASLLVWLALQIDRQVLHALGKVGIGVFAGAVVVFALSQVWGAWRLCLLLGTKRARFPRLLKLTLAAYFLSNFLPTTIGGDVYKGIVLARDGTATARVFSSLLADRTLNVVVAFLMLVGALPFSAFATRYSLESQIGTALLIVGLGIFLVGLVYVARHRIGLLAALLSESRALLGRPGVVVAACALSLASLGAAVMAQWLLCNGMGLTVRFVDLLAAICLVFFITLAPLSLNGLGVQEVSFVYFLRFLGASEEEAIGFALLSRGLILGTSLIGAVAFGTLGRVPRIASNQHHNELETPRRR